MEDKREVERRVKFKRELLWRPNDRMFLVIPALVFGNERRFSRISLGGNKGKDILVRRYGVVFSWVVWSWELSVDVRVERVVSNIMTPAGKMGGRKK